MARTLQALRRDDETSRLQVAAPPTVSAEIPVDAEEEVPFIEVGGKNMPVEASRSVLASAPKSSPKLQLHRPEPVESPVIEGAKETPADIIAFRPLPGEPEMLAPATERLAPEVVAFHQPDHAISHQYEQVASAIDQQVSGGRSRVLLFTAASPRADTSSVVLNLAVVLGRQRSSRLVVVDAHPREAKTTARLGFAGRPGLRDVLGGFSSLERVLVDTGIESLVALTAGRDNPLPCMVAGEAMLAVLRHLKSRFDCVLIDAPGWDGRPDVTALGAACDAIYLVMRKEDAESESTRNLLQLIPLQGGRLKGCILT
jgi:Mrp family chromosome partitioning ATPase